MSKTLPLRDRKRLAELGSPFYDGRTTSRGYVPTPQRRAFLMNINRLVQAGDIAGAAEAHRAACDFRVTGRANSWAHVDHVLMGERLRAMLGARPARDLTWQAHLLSST